MRKQNAKGLKDSHNFYVTMSAVMSAIDAYAPEQKGENGHNEYKWAVDKKDKLQQLFFQLVRTSDDSVLNNFEIIYNSLIENTLDDSEIDVEYLDYLYKLMLQTRDIVNGKGEYTLFYALLYSWVMVEINNSENPKGKIAKEIIKKTLESLVEFPGKNDHPWFVDFKYFELRQKE